MFLEVLVFLGVLCGFFFMDFKGFVEDLGFLRGFGGFEWFSM